MPRTLRGTPDDDFLSTDADIRRVIGQRGDDTLDGSTHGGGLYGGLGDDTLTGGGNGAVQSHIYGGFGRDVIHLNISTPSAPYGDHVWGGMAEDRFVFTLDPADEGRITGRIDDFDVSRDQIWIDDQKLDLADLPENVRIVAHNGQPWLLIDERALYALEGARQFDGIEDRPGGSEPDHANDNGEEQHFIDWPEDWAEGVPALADIPFTDFYAFFPKDLVTLPEKGLPTSPFTAGPDLRVGTEVAERLIGEDGDDTLQGEGGGDLLHGGEQDDLLYGGDGDDSLSGGLDNDRLYGGPGRDILFGGSGRDVLQGGLGADLLRGNSGSDQLLGGEGADTLMGGWGDDRLFGGAGNDRLYATLSPVDPALPDGGENELSGEEGNDTLHAAENGATTLSGGDGADQFHAAPNAQMVLTDFRPGEDYLDLEGLSPGNAALEEQITSQLREGDGANTDLMLVLGGMTTVMFQNLAQAELADLIAAMGQSAPIDPRPPTPGDDDDDDEEEEPPEEDDGSKSDGSCFVATACYGDPGHPDVVWLRGFRDHILRRSLLGRAFIAFYWLVGPHLARLVDPRRASGGALRRVLGGAVGYGRQRWIWPPQGGVSARPAKAA